VQNISIPWLVRAEGLAPTPKNSDNIPSLVSRDRPLSPLGHAGRRYLDEPLELGVLLQQPSLLLLQGEDVLGRLLEDGCLQESREGGH